MKMLKVVDLDSYYTCNGFPRKYRFDGSCLFLFFFCFCLSVCVNINSEALKVKRVMTSKSNYLSISRAYRCHYCHYPRRLNASYHNCKCQWKNWTLAIRKIRKFLLWLCCFSLNIQLFEGHGLLKPIFYFRHHSRSFVWTHLDIFSKWIRFASWRRKLSNFYDLFDFAGSVFSLFLSSVELTRIRK